jgi:hypothetical protein
MVLCTSIILCKRHTILVHVWIKHKYVPDVFLFIQHMLILKQRKMIAARQNLYSLPIHLDYLVNKSTTIEAARCCASATKPNYRFPDSENQIRIR